MNQILSTVRLAAMLIVGGIAAVLLFTLLGSVIVAVGIFVICAAVAGALHFLIFGKKASVEVHVERSPSGYDMIDITPPRERRPHR